MKEVYEHDFDENNICRKCHKSKKVAYYKDNWTHVCPVIGKEEVAKFNMGELIK
jgi:hypothetical protein